MSFSSHIIPSSPLTEGQAQLCIEQHQFLSQNDHPTLSFVISHAIGFHKELYRPLVKGLAKVLKQAYQHTNIIIVAWDARYHGDSALLNQIRGERYRWVDNALDTKQVIDILKLKEKGQVFGIGHSMGASCMILAESLFPGTFDGLCLIEAAVRRKVVPFQTRLKDPIYASINRRDEWPNREECLKSFLKKPFWKSFHPEALENYVKYGMYDTNHGTVKLKCPKEHEFHMFMCSSMESAMSFTASKTLRIPTHYVFATKSFLKDAKMEYALIQSNSYNTVEYIEGSHMIACEIPDIIVSQIMKLIGRVNSEKEEIILKSSL